MKHLTEFFFVRTIVNSFRPSITFENDSGFVMAGFTPAIQVFLGRGR
jgi:hypothetical protein